MQSTPSQPIQTVPSEYANVAKSVPPTSRRRRHTARTTIAILIALVLAGGAVQLIRPNPIAAVEDRVPTSYAIPGAAPTMPWPSTGQATIGVLGLGSLGQSGQQAPVPIASTAKMMTAYVILADHPLTGNANGPTITITATDVADYNADVAAGDSTVKVALGEQLSERVALEALLIPSGNNIAQILAQWDANGEVPFVAKMNAAAAKLGMTQTHYEDPAGIENTTTSTAVDLVKLAEKQITDSAFANIVAMATVTLPVAGAVYNYNTLLGQDGVIGIKTGSTTAAGGCLVFAAQHTIDGRSYTIVGAVLGQDVGADFTKQLTDVMDASRVLIESAETAVSAYPLVRRGQQVAELVGPGSQRTAVTSTADVTVVGWPGLKFTISTQILPPAKAKAGAVIGMLTATGYGQSASATAVAATRIEPATVLKRLEHL